MWHRTKVAEPVILVAYLYVSNTSHQNIFFVCSFQNVRVAKGKSEFMAQWHTMP